MGWVLVVALLFVLFVVAVASAAMWIWMAAWASRRGG